MLFFPSIRNTEVHLYFLEVLFFYEVQLNLSCQLLNTLYAVGSHTDPFGGDDNEQDNPPTSDRNNVS